jgi:hypothetical protein
MAQSTTGADPPPFPLQRLAAKQGGERAHGIEAALVLGRHHLEQPVRRHEPPPDATKN